MKESKSAALLLQDLPFFSFNPSSMGFFHEKRKKLRERTSLFLLLLSGVLLAKEEVKRLTQPEASRF